MAQKLEKVEWVRKDGRKVERLEIRCDCGESLLCTGFTNTCECGLDYDMDGNKLADRSQWGEETGESINDILRIDADWD